MIPFINICNGLDNWNALTNGSLTRSASNSIMGPTIEFDLSSIPALDSSDEPVNVYVGYNNTYLFLIMIQKSKDIESRYTTELSGVISDMAFAMASSRIGGIIDVTHSTMLPNQITNAEAIIRTNDFGDAADRLGVMNDNSYGPILFEVPKSIFLVPGNRKALFGVKTVKIKRSNVLTFDLIIENWTNGQEANKIYLDASKSCPPYAPIGNYGLYTHLGYDLS